MTDDQYVYLLRAIRDHSGLELASIRDAGTHGADAGWSGFIWTTEAAEFYRAHSDVIDDMLGDDADDFGYADVASFVASFNRSDMADTRDGRDCLLAWYALESVGRMLADRQYARGGVG